MLFAGSRPLSIISVLFCYFKHKEIVYYLEIVSNYFERTTLCIYRCKVTPVFYVNSASLSLNLTHTHEIQSQIIAQCIILGPPYKNILNTGT